MAEEELKVPISTQQSFNGYTFYSYQSARLKARIRLRDQQAGIEIEHRPDGIMIADIHPMPGQDELRRGDLIVEIQERQTNDFEDLRGKNPREQVEIFRECLGLNRGTMRRGPRRGTKHVAIRIVRNKVVWGANPIKALKSQFPLPIKELNEMNSRCQYIQGAIPHHLTDMWIQELYKCFPKSAWRRPRSSKSGWALQRGTAWLVDSKLRNLENYKYGGVNAISIPVDDMNFAPIIMRIREYCCALMGIASPPTAVNINFYEQRENTGGVAESTGWHSDDSYDNPHILSLSLGCPGLFQVRPGQSTNLPKKPTSIILNNGDLITMEGEFQDHFQHKATVHSSAATGNVRINLTFRWI